MKTIRDARSGRISLRAGLHEKRMIHAGALRENVSDSEFILRSACREAERVLADRTTFSLPPDRWRAFVSALEGRPPKQAPKPGRAAKKAKAALRDSDFPRLKKLFSTPTLLD